MSGVKGVLARILLAIAAFTVTLGLFEVGFRVAGYQPIYEVYSKPSILWRHDAQLGWSHEPDSVANYRGPRPWPVEFENEIRINSKGLRGVEPGARGEDAFRILFLGDSVVAGFEVAEHETFSVRVESQLNEALSIPVEVINAGVRGYGTDQSYLYYKLRGRELKPDLVVLHHTANDLRNNMTLHRIRRPFGKSAFSVEADGTLAEHGTPVPRYPLCSAVKMDSRFRVQTIDTPTSRLACKLEMNLSDRSALFTYVTQILQRSPEVLRWLYGLGTTTREVASRGLGAFSAGVAHASDASDASDAEAKLTVALVQGLRDEVERDGATFLFWITPKSRETLEPGGFSESGVESIVAVLEMNRRWAFPIQFENDSHWNAYGHKVIGDELAKMLAGYVDTSRGRASEVE